MTQPRRSRCPRAGWLLAWIVFTLAVAPLARAATVGGEIAVTTDYLFRGVSLSDGEPAAQLDLHASTRGGTFIGGFVSSLRENYGYGPDLEVEIYAGHRFNLSPLWSLTVTAVNYAYYRVTGGSQRRSDDYQELAISLSYLDLWTLSASAAPNAARYYEDYRFGRYPAYTTEASVQWPLVGRLFMTGGIGYYSLTGPFAGGYVYGSAGVALEYRAWRIDAGYYFAGESSRELVPYGPSGNRIAATLSWRF